MKRYQLVLEGATGLLRLGESPNGSLVDHSEVQKMQTDLDYVTRQRDIAWGAIHAIKHGPPTWLSNDQVAAWAQSEADKGLTAVTSPTSREPQP
jgi:hypothetical protein